MPRIRARDVRANVKEYGAEQGMIYTLELMADDVSAMRNTINELVDMVRRCVDTIETLTQAGDGLRRTIEEMRRVHQQGDEHGEQS